VCVDVLLRMAVLLRQLCRRVFHVPVDVLRLPLLGLGLLLLLPPGLVILGDLMMMHKFMRSVK